jgi:hypothetical protein
LAAAVWLGALKPEGMGKTAGKHDFLHSDNFATLLAQSFAVLTALAVLEILRRRGKSLWAQLSIAALLALPLLLIFNSKLGSADITYILNSSDIRDTRSGVNNLLTIGAAVFALLLALRFTALKSMPRATQWLAGIVCGLAAGYAVHSAGALFTMACLILPALAVRSLNLRSVKAGFTAAAMACVAVGAGFVLSDRSGMHPATLAVAILFGMTILCAIAGFFRERVGVAARVPVTTVSEP